MTGEALRVLLAIVSLIFLGWQFRFYANRAQHLLQKWAQENSFQLTDHEVRLFRRGPFLWSSRLQIVYRIHGTDTEGNGKSGWLCCGSPLWGLFADGVEVKWDSIHHPALAFTKPQAPTLTPSADSGS